MPATDSPRGPFAVAHLAGAGGMVVSALLVGAAALAVGEASTPLLLGVLAGVALPLVALVPLSRVPRRAWLAVWPVALIVGLTIVTAVSPPTVALLTPLYAAGFVYAGVTLPPGTGYALAPLYAGALWYATGVDVVDALLRVGIATAVVVAMAEIPARQLVRLRRQRARLVGDQERLVETRRDLDDVLAHYRELFAASPVGLSLADSDGRWVEVNDRLCELLDRPRSEVIGRTAQSFTHPDDLGYFALTDDLVHAAPDGVGRLEKRYLRPDGSSRWAHVSYTIVPGRDGTPWVLAHALDIDERKRAEAELDQSRRRLGASAAIARATQDGRDARPAILQGARLVVGSTFACLVEESPDADHDDLVVTAVDGSAELTGLRLERSGTSMTARAWRSKRPVFVGDLSDTPDVNPLMRSAARAESMLWEPILLDGETVAMLVVGWFERAGSLGPEQGEALDLLVSEATAALRAERARDRLEHSARTDPLTGLSNRRAWDLDLGAVLATAGRAGQPVTLALVDLDRFKSYNDSHGHLAGDDLLRAVGSILRTGLRQGDLRSRWGGEEFAVALVDCDETVAERVLGPLLHALPDSQTCSIGVATWRPGDNPETVLAMADEALYAAKESGRARLVHASPPLGLSG